MKKLWILAVPVWFAVQLPCYADELTPQPIPPGESKNITLGANQSPERELSSTIEPSNMPKMIRGELLRVDGNYYVVRERPGHDVKLHVDRETQIKGSPGVGDRLEAEVTPAGHARSVERR